MEEKGHQPKPVKKKEVGCCRFLRVHETKLCTVGLIKLLCCFINNKDNGGNVYVYGNHHGGDDLKDVGDFGVNDVAFYFI